MPKPFIPEFITVHLGAPNDDVQNVKVGFIEYIKNVASSEIYPTWPEAALRANILAEITFALNRVYNEWYRSQGYNFDITNTTALDQAFVLNRDYYDNIIKIVDNIFNNYVVKEGSVNPYFTQYCDGKYTTCDGLSQWGSVSLANEGYIPFDILKYYYGDDINIIYNAPVEPNIQSYPGRALRLGDSSGDIILLKRELNRISENYPSIPVLSPVNEYFGVKMKAAVEKFQSIFNLDVDGIVGKSTWYKIKFIYTNVKNLSDLYSEGLKLEDIDKKYSSELKLGDSGVPVSVAQYYLAVIAYFDDLIERPAVDGVFDENTEQAVLAFQREYNLPENGVIDRETWNKMLDVYEDTINSIPEQYLPVKNEIFPGKYLTLGMQGTEVSDLQKFILKASKIYSYIPTVTVNGIYDEDTETAVRIIQKRNGLTVNGVTGPLTWDKIVNLSKEP